MKANYFLKANLYRLRMAIVAVMFLFPLRHPAIAKSENRHFKAAELPLKHFEGFYRFPSKVAYILIYQKEGKLIAKQIWDSKEYVLSRVSELAFVSANDDHTATFTQVKDNITGILLNNRIPITKVNYDPGKRISLSTVQFNKLQGRYQFQRDPKLFIEIKADKNGLILHQLWDDKKISFFARSEVDFFNEESSFPIHFNITNKKVEQMICFEKDIWNKLN